jgi:hypothetical protein
VRVHPQERFEEQFASIFGQSADMHQHVVKLDAGFDKGTGPANPTVVVCVADPLALILELAWDIHRYCVCTCKCGCVWLSVAACVCACVCV